MISDKQLVRLVNALEAIEERDSDTTLQRRASAKVDEAFATPTIQYLLEPYENGYWELKTSWNNASAVARYLLTQTKTLSAFEEDPELKSLSIAECAQKVSEQCRNELLRMTSRLSPLHLLFHAIAEIKSGKKFRNHSEKDEWISKVDLEDLRNTFPVAAKIYEEKVYIEGRSQGVGPRALVHAKEGVVYFLSVPRRGGTLHLVAPRKEDVKAFADFYHELGVINDPSINRIFAPDEALFKPYFNMLSGVFLHVIHDEKISWSFSQALDYYRVEDYQHCISTLGLIAEGYLQRIYSTLLREESLSGLTLGQTLDRIHKRIAELLSAPKPNPKAVEPVFSLINSIDANTSLEDLKPVLREIVVLIQDGRTNLGKRIDEITKPSTKLSPFPPRVQESLTELLKWRNAASHNTRVPLGAHEADRTLFCLVRLITWWQSRLKTLDWSKPKLQLIEELTHAAR